MGAWSLTVIALSAVTHIYWNLLAKRSSADPMFFARLQIIGGLMALPFGLIASASNPPQAFGLAMAGVSGFCYLGYYTFMGWSYKAGTLSFAYPVARGVAPAAAALVGVLALRENLSPVGIVGVVLVCSGVVLVGLDERLGKVRWGLSALGFAVGTGLFSAGYMVVDKLGATHADPALYMTVSFLVGGALQSLLFRNAGSFREGWKERNVWLAGLTCAAGYLGVLWVMRVEPVSMVAPVRSMSVVLSVLVGARWLGEPGTLARYVGAGTITLGIFLISRS